MLIAGKSLTKYFLFPNIVISSFSDMAGFTPLHAAARQGNTLLVKTLLEYGADANAMTNTLKLTRKFPQKSHNNGDKIDKKSAAMSLLSYLAANSAGSRFIRNYDTLNECNNCAQHIRIDGVTYELEGHIRATLFS